jgi:hypothetical protein
MTPDEVMMKLYSVVFVDWDATVLKVQSVNVGENATAPSNPIRNEYVFIGWDREFTNVSSDLIIGATYEPVDEVYSVVFVDWDNRVLKVQSVNVGENATAPSNPIRNEYVFIGWDREFTNVSSDLIISATYEPVGGPGGPGGPGDPGSGSWCGGLVVLACVRWSVSWWSWWSWWSWGLGPGGPGGPGPVPGNDFGSYPVVLELMCS